MMLIIVLQSTASIADAHQSHQSGSEHLSFEHDHGAVADRDLTADKNSTSDASTSNVSASEIDFDCHHCCHCHGHHANWIASSFFQLLPVSYRDAVTLYHVDISSVHHELLLRPPRS